MSTQPIYIDVREHNEFEVEHVDGSINLPLSRFAAIAPNFLRMIADHEIHVMCQTGHRAKQAIAIAQQMNLPPQQNLVCYQGGLIEWKKQGNGTSRSISSRKQLPLPRQVQLVIGGMVVIFGVLGYFVSPLFSVLAAATGFGLLVAGATGYCMLASSMARMPWNRSSRSQLRC